MDKLTMAHDWYMKHGKDNYMEQSIKLAFDYADAMQAEADERTKQKAIDDAKASNEFMDDLTAKPNGDEWQPDWSQAPNDADFWQKSSADNYYWYCGDTCIGKAPSFDYKGDWRESLRKRP